MLRLYRHLLLCGLLTLAATPAAASAADTISLTAGSDPVEEVPLPIAVSWTSASIAMAFVTLKPAGPGCAASFAADDPASETIIQREGQGGGANVNQLFAQPGAYELCAYLQDDATSATPRAIAGPLTIAVRSARATIAVQVPARVDPEARYTVTVSVTTELRREIFVTLKPAAGHACAATFALDDPASDTITSRTVQGTQAAETTVTAPAAGGAYLLCAYVQENNSDPSPEATASAQLQVAPGACVAARTALTKAQATLRAAQAAVFRTHGVLLRAGAAARHSHGPRHRVLLGRARLAKRRYLRAVKRRATARKQLAARQADKLRICGA